MQTEAQHVELKEGKLRIKGVPGAEMPVAQVAAVMLTRSDLLPPDMEQRRRRRTSGPHRGARPADDQGRAKSYLTAANACHVALVEIDPGTGKVAILKYWIADDCGVRLNPANVEGMIDGGVAKGSARRCWRSTSTTRRASSSPRPFMDYLLPTIHRRAGHGEESAGDAVRRSPRWVPRASGEGAIHTTPARDHVRDQRRAAAARRAHDGRSGNAATVVDADARGALVTRTRAGQSRSSWKIPFARSVICDLSSVFYARPPRQLSTVNY